MRKSCFPILLFSLIGGCSYYDASLLEPLIVATEAGDVELDASVDTTDAAQDVGSESEADVFDAEQDTGEDGQGSDVHEAGGGCNYVRPPEPPTHAESGGDLDFTVAIYSVDFGDGSSNPETIGYDLDSRCTCHGEGHSCLRKSWASAEVCDGPGGQDNAAGIMMSRIGPYFKDFGSDSWSQAILRGDWTILLRVSNYNGQKNDAKVRLDWYVPDKFPEDKGIPKWDGTDAWPIRTTCLLESKEGVPDIEQPKYYDDNAYVTDGVLVGSFTNSAFQVSADYIIEFNGSFITGKLEEGPNGWQIEGGRLGSRWKLSSLLAHMGRVKILGIPVCTNHPAYAAVKAEFCSHADIFSGLGTPTTPCDSLSAGMLFETRPALLGDISTDEMQPSDCASEVDPANDDCDF